MACGDLALVVDQHSITTMRPRYCLNVCALPVLSTSEVAPSISEPIAIVFAPGSTGFFSGGLAGSFFFSCFGVSFLPSSGPATSGAEPSARIRTARKEDEYFIGEEGGTGRAEAHLSTRCPSARNHPVQRNFRAVSRVTSAKAEAWSLGLRSWDPVRSLARCIPPIRAGHQRSLPTYSLAGGAGAFLQSAACSAPPLGAVVGVGTSLPSATARRAGER